MLPGALAMIVPWLAAWSPVHGSESPSHATLAAARRIGPPEQDREAPGGLELLVQRLRGEGPFEPPPPDVSAPVAPPPLPPLAADTAGWRPDVRGGATLHLPADLGGSDARLETRRFHAGAAVTSGTRDRGARFDLGAEVSEYRFRGVAGIVPGAEAPTEDVALFGLGAAWRDRLGDRWSWQGRVEGRLGGEWGAEPGDAWTASAMLAATRHVDARFGWTFGAMVSTQLEDDIQVIPVLGIDWRIDDRTRIATRGPRIEFSRDLEGALRAFAAVGYESRQYRLDDEGPLPEGAMRDRALTGAIGIDWNPGFEAELLAQTRLRLFVGSALWREIAFLDDDEVVGRSRLQPDLAIGLSFATTF